MMFRVNGAPIFSRGANQIPMEELEGWSSAAAHEAVVQAAAAANMNMLRVWGGGVYLPQIWYDTCDKLGILVFHDMMYAQKGHAPVANAIQEAELRHNVRRLSHHPSIVLWDGCNECTVVTSDPESQTAVYASFVMATVADEDKSRVVWPSCPADGWSAGVHKLTGLPNGEPLLTPDSTAARCTTVPGRQCIEIHRPKWKGTGDFFPTVNSAGSLKPTLGPMVGPHLYGGMFPSQVPLNLTRSDRIGPQWTSLFSSESPGGTCFSSFESMAPTLAPEHWGVHGGEPPGSRNVMAQRNYANDNFITVMFGDHARGRLNDTGNESFKAQLYWSM